MNVKDLRPYASAEGAPASRWRRGLGWALAATLVATAWAAWQDDASSLLAPASTRGPTDIGVRVQPASPLTALSSWPSPPRPRHLLDAPIIASAWQPSEAPPAAVRPALAVSSARDGEATVRRAPPFSYTLIGRLDDGQPLALLAGPLRSIAVKAGDIVDDQWRIDAVGTQSVTLTWLPGNASQQIGFKSS